MCSPTSLDMNVQRHNNFLIVFDPLLHRVIESKQNVEG